MHGSLFKDAYIVAKHTLKLKNAINNCLINLNIILYHAFLSTLILAFTHPCWFSFNNSQKVTAGKFIFYCIKYVFIRDSRAKFGISNFLQSSVIGQSPNRL